MSRSTIVATGPIEPPAFETLQPFGELVIAPDTTEESLLPLLEKAIGVILRGDGRFSTKAVAAAPALKVIGRSGVGFNNVAVEAATARGIPVIYTPGAGARAVAEAAMAWMLAMSKRVVFWDQQMKSGNWRSRFEQKSGDLEGATLGIVGFGRIGRQLAKLAVVFDMEIVAFDPFVPAEVMCPLGVSKVALDELMAQSDFICVHAAATPENAGLIDREVLKGVKPGAHFINLARGELVENLDNLYEALMDGRFAGVALDVFVPEPMAPHHPIFQHPNVLTAPHSIAGTQRSIYRIFQSMSQDMAAVLRGERPQFVVNPEVFEATS